MAEKTREVTQQRNDALTKFRRDPGARLHRVVAIALKQPSEVCYRVSGRKFADKLPRSLPVATLTNPFNKYIATWFDHSISFSAFSIWRRSRSSSLIRV